MNKPINYYITEEKDRLIRHIQQAVNASPLPPSIIAIILDSAAASYRLSALSIAQTEKTAYEEQTDKTEPDHAETKNTENQE